ncbi:MAG TPA: PIN domain-containing protein [Terracidiphilus sp.]|jgi:tRNA(fMet)-specific endonuclease VapC|nr:PIN domain-containing protein [Terracidiphilus sp.]
MLHYMLDTDISSYIMNRSNTRVLRELQTKSVDEVCISAITRSELEYGVEVSPRREKDRKALAIFLTHIEVLDFPGEAALHYAEIRAFLKRNGLIIGGNDMLIAAHARFLGLNLVTDNTREFGRVKDLKVENWA